MLYKNKCHELKNGVRSCRKTGLNMALVKENTLEGFLFFVIIAKCKFRCKNWKQII
jgi:hypothetical protein